MHKVYQAEPYRFGAMGSLGDASGMLIRQYNFPNTYQDNEEIWSADHDRMIMWDRDHWELIIEQYIKKGQGFQHFVENANAKNVLACLAELTKEPNKLWTGFRVLGTVNRSNGYPVYSIQLFAKKKSSNTSVYTGSQAPNVKRAVRHSFRSNLYT